MVAIARMQLGRGGRGPPLLVACPVRGKKTGDRKRSPVHQSLTLKNQFHRDLHDARISLAGQAVVAAYVRNHLAEIGRA
jgi:hypothetical protein